MTSETYEQNKQGIKRMESHINEISLKLDVRLLKNTVFRKVLTSQEWEKVMCDYDRYGNTEALSSFLRSLYGKSNGVSQLDSVLNSEDMRLNSVSDILMDRRTNEPQTEQIPLEHPTVPRQLLKEATLDTLFHKIPYKSFVNEKLRRLDYCAAQSLTRNWEFLAEKLGLGADDIAAANTAKFSPTLTMLDLWQSSVQLPTLGELLQALYAIQRLDVLYDISTVDGYNWINNIRFDETDVADDVMNVSVMTQNAVQEQVNDPLNVSGKSMSSANNTDANSNQNVLSLNNNGNRTLTLTRAEKKILNNNQSLDNIEDYQPMDPKKLKAVLSLPSEFQDNEHCEASTVKSLQVARVSLPTKKSNDPTLQEHVQSKVSQTSSVCLPPTSLTTEERAWAQPNIIEEERYNGGTGIVKPKAADMLITKTKDDIRRLHENLEDHSSMPETSLNESEILETLAGDNNAGGKKMEKNQASGKENVQGGIYKETEEHEVSTETSNASDENSLNTYVSEDASVSPQSADKPENDDKATENENSLMSAEKSHTGSEFMSESDVAQKDYDKVPKSCNVDHSIVTNSVGRGSNDGHNERGNIFRNQAVVAGGIIAIIGVSTGILFKFFRNS
ncbi:uncharacterized protein LOC141900406 isoform X1 [Tubulanus polymorphus]|uniref:uncharacterized protein LOC141900406 isoform X1 n=1 Tax=Tubulanus polymorphus TaxID=672921 RepID=UPI003DA3D649